MPRRKIQVSRFYLALGSFLVGQMLILEGAIGTGALVGMLTAFVPFAAFFFLCYQGYSWGRWVLIVLLLFMSVTCLSDGVTGSEPVFIFSGVAHLAAVVFVFLAGFVRQQQEPLPVIDLQIEDLEEEPEQSAPTNTGNFIQAGISYEYPPLVTRYKAVLIDFFLLFAILIITMVVLGDSEYRSPVMITLGLLSVFVYDPVLTAYSATIGQRAMKIRVRRFSNPTEKVGILSAYFRAIVKWPLGWLSFITVNFNPEHRAIHDFASGSVVIKSGNSR